TPLMVPASSSGTRVMLDFLKGFARHNGGNVALTFGLALIPIVGMVGAAIDYSSATRVRAALQAAADAASVGSVAKASPAMAAAAAMSKDGSIAAGVTDALNIFNAEIAGRTGVTVKRVSAKVTASDGGVTGAGHFSADVPTPTLGVLGRKTFAVSGTANAANGMPPFIDFYLLLDNTPSMGVAATSADIATMVNNTSDQCAFACHDQSDPKNYYKLAK